MKQTIEDLIKPFEPYIKRYGFGYVTFINGTALFTKDWGQLCRELWDEDQEKYHLNVFRWWNKQT